MRDMMRSAARPMRRSCSGDRTSMTSDRTWATCPGAASASAWKPLPVRIALVNRPSVGSASRRTKPRPSRRLTRCDSLDSDALVTSASELIRMVRCGLSDSMARAWYSTIPSFESRCSCWSIDQGSQVIKRTTESQESSSAGVSHFTGSSPLRWAPSVIGSSYLSLDDSSDPWAFRVAGFGEDVDDAAGQRLHLGDELRDQIGDECGLPWHLHRDAPYQDNLNSQVTRRPPVRWVSVRSRDI